MNVIKKVSLAEKYHLTNEILEVIAAKVNEKEIKEFEFNNDRISKYHIPKNLDFSVFPFLESLVLKDFAFTSKNLETLKGTAKIKNLTLVATTKIVPSIPTLEIDFLNVFPNLESLVLINFSKISFRNSDKVIKKDALKEVKIVSELAKSSCYISGISAFSNIERLELQVIILENSLQELCSLKNLSDLTIHYATKSIINDLDSLVTLNKLKIVDLHFSVSGISFLPVGLRLLTELEVCNGLVSQVSFNFLKRLKKVRIINTKVYLINVILPELEELELLDNNLQELNIIEGPNLKVINLKGNPNLEETRIFLPSNKINDISILN